MAHILDSAYFAGDAIDEIRTPTRDIHHSVVFLGGDFAGDVPIFVDKWAIPAIFCVAETKTSGLFFGSRGGLYATLGECSYGSATRFEKVSD